MCWWSVADVVTHVGVKLLYKTRQPSYSSCRNVPTNESGVFLISVNNASSPFQVYCEQKGGWRREFGSGWLVVQHRFDGSVDFYRNWTEYREGFGELDGEFWLGLERIHQLTTARPHELVVEVKDFRGNYGFARYSEFQVGSEMEEYELKTLGSYTGTAGDGLTPNEGTKFSTKDRDHNAVYYDGAWWYGDGYSNLNGRYKNANGVKSIWWHNFKNGRLTALSFTRMMIREL
ncbi:fibrinogen C domain-containing protein 1-like [Anopheles aquasalis]|uniref:fibrinogen C domain-containing protein 1-like n=1 Tax=Anopheles aquasalis TaxID=42839 RepID=UPI00215A746B|nr:fibrinogen C domain-containing protein 1-like [Anopheles aquasalis]